MSKLKIRNTTLVLALFWVVVSTMPATAQDIRASLFTAADGLIAEGEAVRANVLAPKNWGKAMERYASAERKLAEGKNLDDIRKELAQATTYFQDAIKATDLAVVTLAVPLKARDAAASVDAVQNAPQLWQQAELKFAEAGRKLEEGNVNDARKRGAEAETLFRDAELSAIKTSFFDETRVLLARAEKEKVEKYAPATLVRSRELLAEAESALNENRYDTDRPRSLAIEAKYEALHALQLAKLVKMTDEKVMSREELILAAEKPLAQVAATLDIKAEFDEGFTKPTESVVAAIEALESENGRLESDLRDRDEQVAQLETQLGGASEAQAVLQVQVAAQEVARQRFAQVEQQFTRDEARVLRERGEVIIRLVGMNFTSGQSVIRPDHFSLLTKVKAAIAVYPDANVVIEGYTDAYGTDEANLRLSQQRAEAVAQYLLANSSLSSARLEAVGFGEANPIANNETKEGRAKNRRIDIVIKQGK